MDGSDDGPPLFTSEFIKEGWGLAGYAGGLVFKDPDTWKLYEEEADTLTDRTRRWIQSLDKKALKKFEKKYGKHFPALMLAVSVVTVFGPRAATSIRRKTYLRHEPPVTSRDQHGTVQNAPATGRAPGAPAPASSDATVPVGASVGYAHGAGSAGADGRSHEHGTSSDLRERPLTRAEVAEVFDVAD